MPAAGMDLPEYIKQRRAAGSENRLLEMAKMNGMEYVPLSRLHNTRLAHEATEFARESGRANEFHHAVFPQAFSLGLDISSLDLVRLAADEVGPPAPQMQYDV